MRLSGIQDNAGVSRVVISPLATERVLHAGHGQPRERQHAPASCCVIPMLCVGERYLWDDLQHAVGIEATTKVLPANRKPYTPALMNRTEFPPCYCRSQTVLRLFGKYKDTYVDQGEDYVVELQSSTTT